ncbi:MAG: hypothetical protein ACHQ7M_01040 [Chloroflexota bacterium]
MFVQLIRFRSTRIDEIQALSEDYDSRSRPIGQGPTGTEVLQVQGEPNTYIALARFASAEKARENSARPETNEWFRGFTALIDGKPEFSDSEQIYEHWAKVPVS